MSTMIPCMNPARCGVSQHEAGSASARHCRVDAILDARAAAGAVTALAAVNAIAVLRHPGHAQPHPDVPAQGRREQIGEDAWSAHQEDPSQDMAAAMYRRGYRHAAYGPSPEDQVSGLDSVIKGRRDPRKVAVSMSGEPRITKEYPHGDRSVLESAGAVPHYTVSLEYAADDLEASLDEDLEGHRVVARVVSRRDQDSGTVEFRGTEAGLKEYLHHYDPGHAEEIMRRHARRVE